jgi:hypothetical protein
MNMIRGVVRNGRIETTGLVDWPEGTRVVVSLAPGGLDEEEWDNSPEAIAAWLKWYDSLEPLIFTAEKEAAWEAHRQEHKAWEKAHFDEWAERARQVWE